MLVDASAETPLCSSAKTHSLATDPDETPLIVADLDIAPVHRAKAVPSAADPDPAVVDVDPVDAAEALPPAADPDPAVANVDPVDEAEAPHPLLIQWTLKSWTQQLSAPLQPWHRSFVQLLLHQ